MGGSENEASPLNTTEPTQKRGDNRIERSSLVGGFPRDANREERISRRAYYKAQQRDFEPGHDWEDWFAAEREETDSDSADAPD